MYMAFCCDHTFCKLYFSCRANQLTCARTSNVAGFTDRSGNAKTSCISKRNLYLCIFSYRTQNRHFLASLCSYYLYLFFTGKLSRLA